MVVARGTPRCERCRTFRIPLLRAKPKSEDRIAVMCPKCWLAYGAEKRAARSWLEPDNEKAAEVSLSGSSRSLRR